MCVPSCTHFLADVDHPTRPRAVSWYVVALVQPVGAGSDSTGRQDTLYGQIMPCFCCCLRVGEGTSACGHSG
jgi:hypothetical protein